MHQPNSDGSVKVPTQSHAVPSIREMAIVRSGNVKLEIPVTHYGYANKEVACKQLARDLLNEGRLGQGNGCIDVDVRPLTPEEAKQYPALKH